MRCLNVLGVTALLAACGGPRVAEDPLPVNASEPPSVASAGPTLDELPELEPGVTWGGLSIDGPADADGHALRRYGFWGPPGHLARVTLSAPGMDVLLRVVFPDGRELVNDDFAGTDSRLQFALPESGRVEVVATTFAAGAYGKYRLELELLNPDEGIALPPDGVVDANLLDQPAPFLETPDAEIWFRATRGERLQFRVTSPDFDTVATVYSPAGISWSNDDANDPGPDGTESIYDSSLSIIAPDEGLYQLVVAAYGDPGDGSFRVRAERMPPPLLGPDGETPTVGFAGPDGSGRVLAVLAGVTMYNDAPLYGCADDAAFLADAMQARGLIEPENLWLLTDKAATRDAFRAALAEAAEAAGPDDLVLVFFSGHGNMIYADGSDPNELDGTDETIVLADGQVVDNELMSWLDPIGAGNLMLAVDACHSGGLARDFMTRPGRIGIFSSDEDVLSSTAEVVGAGGFLSHALRRAFAGFADERPHDGALTAGELTDYMLEAFVEQHRAMNPAGSLAPLQRLVVERGSFGWDDLLLVFPRTFDGEEIPLPIDCWHSGTPEPAASDVDSCR